MVPSEDPLPFKLLLGYMSYPTDTSLVAGTEMPLTGATLGNRQLFLVCYFTHVYRLMQLKCVNVCNTEERYTWLLDPDILRGNTGTYYLVVRPIVGPGIKSINATLSITSVSASCKFWNDSASGWGTYGCRVSKVPQFACGVTLCLKNNSDDCRASRLVLIPHSRSLSASVTISPFSGALFLLLPTSSTRRALLSCSPPLRRILWWSASWVHSLLLISWRWHVHDEKTSKTRPRYVCVCTFDAACIIHKTEEIFCLYYAAYFTC